MTIHDNLFLVHMSTEETAIISEDKKGLPANFNQAKEKKSKRSRRRNASKCCLYESSSGSEGQCSSNLLTTDHSPDDGFVENCSADNLSNHSIEKEGTKPSGNEQVAELSEGEIVEEADIEPYKQQDEFFTTGIAGVKLEPQYLCSEDEDVFVVQQLRNKPNTIMANREIVGLNQLSINDEEWPSLS
ncbi:hypothetical protein D918_05035 [Trichuris suis]|nr:hypothetical protein D918_05035 [Trichuris suis]